MSFQKVKKTSYTQFEIAELHKLIDLRRSASSSEQKRICGIMREKLGFYGRDDWGIVDLDHYHLDELITSGRITVGNGTCKTLANISRIPEKVIVNDNDIKEIIQKFKANKFTPSLIENSSLPQSPGNYIICLKPNSSLPKTMPLPRYTNFEGLNVLYTGISINLQDRDYKQHFTGNDASWSTLRKSIGVLFNFTFVPRVSKKNPLKVSNKFKFSDDNEKKLSEWMKNNLVLFLPV